MIIPGSKPNLLSLLILFVLCFVPGSAFNNITQVEYLSSEITREELLTLLETDTDLVLDLLYVQDEDDYINYFDLSELFNQVSITDMEEEDILKSQEELEDELKDIYTSLQDTHDKLMKLANFSG